MKKSKVFLLAAVGLLSVGVLTACSSSRRRLVRLIIMSMVVTLQPWTILLQTRKI